MCIGGCARRGGGRGDWDVIGRWCWIIQVPVCPIILDNKWQGPTV